MLEVGRVVVVEEVVIGHIGDPEVVDFHQEAQAGVEGGEEVGAGEEEEDPKEETLLDRQNGLSECVKGCQLTLNRKTPRMIVMWPLIRRYLWDELL